MNKTEHLDMGCGAYPKYLYGIDKLYGLNIGDYAISANIRQANLSIDRIPFEDNFFDSVSAFGVLEQACVCWRRVNCLLQESQAWASSRQWYAIR